jgi:EmrB/QacA subfamily drug resistance transporter
LSIAMVATFMAILDSFIVIVAAPAISADLGASSGVLQWSLAGYQLTYAALLITGGRLGDRFGYKRALIAGMAVFTLASLACAISQSGLELVVARLLESAGAALMVPQVFALITTLTPGAERHRVFAVLGVVIGLATVSGQLLGGLLISADLFGTGWRPVFWINLPIGLITVVLAARLIPASRVSRRHPLDITGVAVLGAALLLLSFPLIQGREAGWPWWTWLSLAASIACFALFAATQRDAAARGRDPLIPLSLFSERSFSLGIALVLAVYALLTSYYLVLSVAMQEGLGLSPLGAGLVYTPAAVTFFVFGLVAARLAGHGRRLLELGAIVLASGYAATAIVLLGGVRLSPGTIIPTLVLQSVGGGLLIAQLLNAVLARIDPKHTGAASGVLSTAQQVGGAIGVAAIGIVFFGSFDPAHQDPVASAGHALGLSSLFTLAVAAAAAVMVRLLPPLRLKEVGQTGERVSPAPAPDPR